MSTSVLFMSMSVDGYIAGPTDEVGTPGGDGFDRLGLLVEPLLQAGLDHLGGLSS